jgi:hypothetical protein
MRFYVPRDFSPEQIKPAVEQQLHKAKRDRPE